MLDRDLEQDDSDFYPDWADGLTQEEYEVELVARINQKYEDSWEEGTFEN